MILTAPQSQDLINHIITALVGANPDCDRRLLLQAILQSAGCERKLEGAVQTAMNQWLHSANDACAQALICMSEHRHRDFVWFRRAAVGSDRLVIENMFEAKFNYTSQTAELANRPLLGAAQMAAYQARHPNVESSLLWILADNEARPAAPRDSDKGWAYLAQPAPGRFAGGVAMLQASAAAAGLVSEASAQVTQDLGGWQIHLELFKLQGRPAATASNVDNE